MNNFIIIAGFLGGIILLLNEFLSKENEERNKYVIFFGGFLVLLSLALFRVSSVESNSSFQDEVRLSDAKRENSNIKKVEDEIKFNTTDVPGRTILDRIKRKDVLSKLLSDDRYFNERISFIKNLNRDEFDLKFQYWLNEIENSTQDPLIDRSDSKKLYFQFHEKIWNIRRTELLNKIVNKLPPRIISFSFPDLLNKLSKLKEEDIQKNIIPNYDLLLSSKTAESIVNQTLTRKNYNFKDILRVVKKNNNINSIEKNLFLEREYYSVRAVKDNLTIKEDFEINRTIVSSSYIIASYSLTAFILETTINELEKQ